jgi:polyisoprenoid-binding protein YceI
VTVPATRRLRTRAAGVLFALAGGIGLVAQGAAWRIADGGEVVVHCPLTVGGSFQAKTSAISGQLAPDPSNPSKLTGEMAVDLKTLDSGISLRNTHMRENYLEVGKGDGYDRAVLSEITLGGGDVTTINGSTTFAAMLQVHGTKKPVSGQVKVTRSGSDVRVEASFPVSLTDFGVAEPRYLGVGVKDQVQVRVKFGGTR